MPIQLSNNQRDAIKTYFANIFKNQLDNFYNMS